MKKLSSREKIFAIAGVAALLAYGLAEFVVLPASAIWNNGEERIALAQRRLRRERELVAARQLPARVAAARAQLQQEQKRLLQGKDANQAGAQLQSWLAQQAAAQQLEVLRSDFLPPAPVTAEFVRVPVRIELHGRISQITAYLAAVTQGNQIASVDEMQFSSYGDAKQKQVHCVVVVSGLMAKGG
ncbi:MAG TPA: type II secretion system protein GspM [Candidatus Acidoferrales bacterium]|nr:type II secretion system protein GspM [Candidatus Acidoferrales bacterium]